MIVHDIETFNTDKAVPYAKCIHGLSKISGKYYRDISEKECEKCKKDRIVFNGLDKKNEMLDYVSRFKGEAKGVDIKIVEYKLYIIAHKG